MYKFKIDTKDDSLCDLLDKRYFKLIDRFINDC